MFQIINAKAMTESASAEKGLIYRGLVTRNQISFLIEREKKKDCSEGRKGGGVVVVGGGILSRNGGF